ncbi:MAG: tRNA pseudouridine(55) synthase TruB [Bacilli bacterium]|nr:tRNA pseudouridine(55) synthase TruB [Bacilli bacterium]
MNGILIIDKPKDFTSRDIVNIISKTLNTKKVGHTGTLDPIATGVLVLCVGKALKLTELLTSTNKEYVATLKLGVETDTLDITGKVLNKKEVSNISEEEIINTLNKFKGHIKQQVPKYSAIKVNGKKLYEYARKGLDVELPIRDVEIKNIELLDYQDNLITFKCNVSKGTYIRSLIRDIGYSLGNYATMMELRRVKQGDFGIEQAYTLEDIENSNYELLNPVDVVDLPIITVDNNLLFKVRNGQVLDKFFDDDKVMIVDKDNNLVAIYMQSSDNKVKPYKVF